MSGKQHRARAKRRRHGTRAVRRALVVACAASAFALAAPAVAGQTLTFSSTPTISKRAPYFHGSVVSGSVCEKRRKVRLFKRRPGPDRLLGKGRTGRRGNWLIRAKRKRGVYYAKVKPARRQRGTTTYVCKKGFSRRIAIR
jgi:hypothetical protein